MPQQVAYPHQPQLPQIPPNIDEPRRSARSTKGQTGKYRDYVQALDPSSSLTPYATYLHPPYQPSPYVPAPYQQVYYQSPLYMCSNNLPVIIGPANTASPQTQQVGFFMVPQNTTDFRHISMFLQSQQGGWA